MILKLRAVFRDGVFCPSTPCVFPENAEVELLVKVPSLIPPTTTDSRERDTLLAQVTARMTGNPLPVSAPRFSRDELHERG